MATRTTIENGYQSGSTGLRVNDDGSIKVVIYDSSGNPAKIITDFEFLNGSSGTGGSFNKNRTFTLTTTDEVEIIGVWLQTQLLTPVTSYTKDDTNKQVTISETVNDSDVVAIMYRH